MKAPFSDSYIEKQRDIELRKYESGDIGGTQTEKKLEAIVIEDMLSKENGNAVAPDTIGVDFFFLLDFAGALAGAFAGAAGASHSFSASPVHAIALYTRAAKTPPTSGATMNTHTLVNASPPAKIAGPKLLAGLTEVPVK